MSNTLIFLTSLIDGDKDIYALECLGHPHFDIYSIFNRDILSLLLPLTIKFKITYCEKISNVFISFCFLYPMHSSFQSAQLSFYILIFIIFEQCLWLRCFLILLFKGRQFVVLISTDVLPGLLCSNDYSGNVALYGGGTSWLTRFYQYLL